MLVTNDRTDFTTLVQREPRHPSLVCITVAHGLMSFDVQTRLFEHALVRLEGQDIAGRVLEIALRADRKRISRIKPPVRRFPVQLFPKGESFLYLEQQRSSERFWTSLHAALRDANSICGYAIDGLLARGGVVL